MNMCDCDEDDFHILPEKNPFCDLNNINPSPRPLFLDFDFVHIQKCIRNNWIRADTKGVLWYPVEVNGQWQVQPANWNLLRSAHRLEEHAIIRLMPRLTAQALQPGSFARQNVSLSRRPFCLSTVVGFERICEKNPTEFLNWQPTAQFLKMIDRWWECCNVQYPGQGACTRDPDQEPFRSTSDPRIQFFKELLHMLVF